MSKEKINKFYELGKELSEKISKNQVKTLTIRWSDYAISKKLENFQKEIMELCVNLEVPINPLILEAGSNEIQALCAGLTKKFAVNK